MQPPPSTPSQTVQMLPTGVRRGPARPRRRNSDEDDLWLVSYGDMITLLFCFFALMLSFSRLDMGKVEHVSSQVSAQFNPSAPPTGLSALKEQIGAIVQKAGLKGDVDVRHSERGLQIDLNARLLFEPASADLSERAMDVLDELMPPLARHAVTIEVEGHTDPLPIESERFPSNWELSSARASSVVRYLIDVQKLDGARLRAVGLADTMPVDRAGAPLSQPLPKSEWTEAYLARQRRVTLVLTPVPPDLAEILLNRQKPEGVELGAPRVRE